jgi:uncharacterized protein (DUF362 family)
MPDFSYHSTSDKYPEIPFHPPEVYAEFIGFHTAFDSQNKVFNSVRNLFFHAGYDKENAGTSNWNPFRGYISENQTVLIKPNLVIHETGRLEGLQCLTTHASLIRPIVDYLLLLQKQDSISFEIIIADVPIQSADFNLLIKQNGLLGLMEYYNTIANEKIKLLDLRHIVAVREGSGFIRQHSVTGDTNGYSKIHLENSFLKEIEKDFKKFGVSGYDPKETRSQITSTGKHLYHIPNTVLDANLIINIPKLKTHQKAGITIAMKNLIGINGEKAWIPHYRIGSVKSGGDEYDDKQILLKSITTKTNRYLQGKSKLLWTFGKKVNKIIVKPLFRKDVKRKKGLSEFDRKAMFITAGAWHGNDTLWRPILDLNYLLFHVNKNGTESDSQIRKYICITDGIISGEGDGPLQPNPKKTGIIGLSENPVLNDVCFAKLMGFDWRKIPKLQKSTKLQKYFNFIGDTTKIKITKIDSENACENIKYSNLESMGFKPPPGWINHIEL